MAASSFGLQRYQEQLGRPLQATAIQSGKEITSVVTGMGVDKCTSSTTREVGCPNTCFQIRCAVFPHPPFLPGRTDVVVFIAVDQLFLLVEDVRRWTSVCVTIECRHVPPLGVSTDHTLALLLLSPPSSEVASHSKVAKQHILANPTR
jgi:hypothetical protein